MNLARPRNLFLLSVAAGAIAVAGAFGVSRWRSDRAVPAHPLAPGIAISEQLQPEAMAYASDRFVTVIDMRPDGEAAGQPSSAQMAAAAQAQHLQFAYVPVPHGDIPDAVVDKLSTALADHSGPVLLYCRSGRRAARSWSLVEASRPGGLDVDRILAAVKTSGQDASDLRASLEQRVRARRPAAGAGA
ncbi:MAG TPA: TIGR01244 family sulfur transferase [Burkholderiaceae bacterium]